VKQPIYAGPRSLRQLLDAVMTTGSDLDLEAVLTHIVESAVALADAHYDASACSTSRAPAWLSS